MTVTSLVPVSACKQHSLYTADDACKVPFLVCEAGTVVYTSKRYQFRPFQVILQDLALHANLALEEISSEHKEYQ